MSFQAVRPKMPCARPCRGTLPWLIVAAATFVAAACSSSSGGGGASDDDGCVDDSDCGSGGEGGQSDLTPSAGKGGAGESGSGGQNSGGTGGDNSGGVTVGGSGGSGNTAGSSGGGAGGNGGMAGGMAGTTGGAGGMTGMGGRPGPAGPWKFLFVGNSFTFNSGIAGKTKDIVTQGQKDVVISTSDIAVNWNRGLYYHWNIGTTVDNKKTLDLIRSKTYTHIALQDYMMSPTDKGMPSASTGEGTYGVEIASDYGKRFINEVKANGQVPVIWSIWPDRRRQTDFEALILAYKKIAEDNGAVFVPASAAWFLALKERPNLAFWDSDNYHPSNLGGYACACVFYAVLTGKSPVGNPYTLRDVDANTQKFIQEKAWEAYLTYGTKKN